VLRQIMLTPALGRVLLWSLAMAAYSVLPVIKERGQFAQFGDFSTGLEAILALAISLFLAFRMNRAFERWWEARTLWGTLVNACRNLAVKANNVVHPHDESIEDLRQLIVAFPCALRDHLRSSAEQIQFSGLGGRTFDGDHVPSWIVNQIYGVMDSWKRERRIQDVEFWVLDREARILLEVCGACERIKNTPIAVSFHVFLNQALLFFLLTLPWGIVNEFGLWTVPISFLTSYFVIAAEGIADDVEHPFRAGGDGLDLDRLCHGIESSVNEIFEAGTQMSVDER
jgi:putative membrane protein